MNYVVSVAIVETRRGDTVREGIVEVFRVSERPPELAYRWAVAAPEGPEYVAVLGEPPVDSPLPAIRT